MNTNSHILTAKIVRERLICDHNIALPKNSFILGNIRPDYSVKYKKIPHYKEQMYPMFKDMIKEVLSSSDINLNVCFVAYELGVICHFLCDFFCYAHNGRFFGSLCDHFKYESLLYNFIKSRYDKIRRIDYIVDRQKGGQKDIMDNLDALFNDYYKCDPQPCVDMVFSMTACLNVTVSIVKELFLNREFKKLPALNLV